MHGRNKIRPCISLSPFTDNLLSREHPNLNKLEKTYPAALPWVMELIGEGINEKISRILCGILFHSDKFCKSPV